jgi:hypothetical protein
MGRPYLCGGVAGDCQIYACDGPDCGHRQLVVHGISDGAMGLMAVADGRDYATIATPVTSAQIVKA